MIKYNRFAQDPRVQDIAEKRIHIHLKIRPSTSVPVQNKGIFNPQKIQTPRTLASEIHFARGNNETSSCMLQG